jgi:RNA recognition motif-containing protein
VRLFDGPATRDRVAVLFVRRPKVGKKLYVGSLSYNVTGAELQKQFAAFGTVTSADVVMDRETGRSKGFGFVEMSTDEEAKAAIAGLNGKELDGRSMIVNEARPKPEGGRGGGRGGFGGGGGGGGGRGGFGGGGGGRGPRY